VVIHKEYNQTLIVHWISTYDIYSGQGGFIHFGQGGNGFFFFFDIVETKFVLLDFDVDKLVEVKLKFLQNISHYYNNIFAFLNHMFTNSI